MSLRIACDLDGTVADMDAALQREAQRLFGDGVNLHAVAGTRLASAEDDDSRALTARELHRLWTHVAQIPDFWTSLAEVESGAVASLAELAARHRWEIIFLTQRPSSAGTPTQLQSQRWLRAHGFEFPSVMVMHGSRGKVAAALSLDVVLDDRPENCLDVIADSTARPLLVWRLPPEKLPPAIGNLGIERVGSMAHALTRLEELTAAKDAPGGVFDRLRRVIRRRH